LVKGDLNRLVSAYVRGEGITAAAQAAGMSRSTAWNRIKSPEAQRMIQEVRAEMRAEFQDWPLRVRAVGDIVLDAIVEVLDREPEPVVVARLAGVILPELRYLLADAHQWAPTVPAVKSGDAKAELMRKFGLMEARARQVIEDQDAREELKRTLGIIPPND
jgi:hypothetical protein